VTIPGKIKIVVLANTMSYNFNCNNDFSIFATETKTTMLEQQFSSLIIILFETEIT